MILTIFLFLSITGFVLSIVGFAMDIPLITILGAVLVFGTGIAIIGNEVEIKTGENITNTLTINGSISSQLIRDNYEPYDFGGVGSTSFGRIITILGFILFIFSLISIRS